MHIALSLGFGLISASIYSFAQGALPAPVRAVDGTRASGASACPLDMRVRHSVGGKTIAVDEYGARVETFAQRLKLLLNDPRPNRASQRMIKARVTVRGWNGKEQILPAGSTRDRDWDLARISLTVPLIGGVLSEASADLTLPGFTAASTVELQSVTFDDGAVWSFSGSTGCRVAPDLYMPVND